MALHVVLDADEALEHAHALAAECGLAFAKAPDRDGLFLGNYHYSEIPSSGTMACMPSECAQMTVEALLWRGFIGVWRNGHG